MDAAARIRYTLRRSGERVSVTLAVAALCALGAHYLPFVRVAENWVADIRVANLSLPAPQSKRIVVAAITEDTLSRFPYRSPIDRRFLAKLVRTLEDKGAAAIGFDILFDQATEPEKDDALHTTLARSRAPVVVAWASGQDGLTDAQQEFLGQYTRDFRRGLVRVLVDDSDGVTRSMALRVQEGEASVPALAAALADLEGARVPDADVLDLAYRGRPEGDLLPFAVYPAHAVDVLPADWLRGRIVLVGVTLPLDDRHRTPLSLRAGARADIPGVLIHAHALSQLIEGPGYRQPGSWQRFAVVAAFALVGVLIAAVEVRGVRTLLGTAWLVLAWVGGFWLFRAGGLLVPLVAPTIAFLAGHGVETTRRWRREQATRRFITSAFGKYVAPDIISRLIADPSKLSLTGERRELTFLFTDIAGFTGLIERTEPRVFTTLLNDYLDNMSNVVLRHGGTIDKFVGDALHVFFNAPGEQADHAERAVRCALDLDRFAESFREQQHRLGVELGETRIGVNTGVTVVGNFGGETRFDYTAHGDAINVAARLESLNKHLGTRICVGETTAKLCQETRFRPVGRLILKGKSQGIEVLEPVADGSRAGESLTDYRRAYALMEREAPEAAQAFAELAARFAEDGLIAFHARRLGAGASGATVLMDAK